MFNATIKTFLLHAIVDTAIATNDLVGGISYINEGIKSNYITTALSLVSGDNIILNQDLNKIEIDKYNIYNADTVSHLITIKEIDLTNPLYFNTLGSFLLLAGYTLQYDNDYGFRILDTDGLVVNGPGPTGPAGPAGSGVAVLGGTNSYNTGTVSFANSNGVSFGLNTNNVMTASVVGAAGLSNIKISAGTLSNHLSALTFDNSNGVSFGLNGSVLTASVVTDYQSTGLYLTTAMLSNAGSNFVGLNSALTGNGISATINSSGISIDVPAYLTTAQPVGAYLTTAMLSNAVTLSNINVSGGTTSNNLSAFVLDNSNGVSFGLNNGTITASVVTDYQSTGAYLTTAMGSNAGSNFVGLNSALTANGVSASINSSGISLNFPAFLTTAMQSNAVTLSNINVSAGTTSNNLSEITFSNSNGISFGLSGSVITGSHNGLTSQDQNLTLYATQNTTQNSSTILNASSLMFNARGGISAGFTNGSIQLSVLGPNNFIQTTAGLNLTNISATLASDSISLSVGNYLTTAMDSNAGSNFVGLNSALTGNGISATINSSGISLNVPAFLTTAMASNAATISNIKVSAGTLSNNLSDLTFDNSNGISFGLNGSNITGSFGLGLSAGNGIQTTVSSLTFANANGVSFGLNGNTLTATVVNTHTLGLYAVGNTTQSTSGSMNIQTVSFRGEGVASVGISNGSVIVSVPSGGGGLTNINVSAGTQTNDLSNLIFSNANGVSFGLDNSTITASCDGNITYNGFNPNPNIIHAYIAQGAGTMHVQKMPSAPNFTFDRVVMGLQYSNASNSSNSCTVSLSFGIYSLNASTLSLIGSNSTSFNITNSGTAGSYSLYSGARLIDLPMSSSLSAGDYYIGIWSRTTTGGGAGMTINQIGRSALNSAFAGRIGLANNASYGPEMGLGVYSVSFSTAMPSAISMTQLINGTATAVQRSPFYSFAHTTF